MPLCRSYIGTNTLELSFDFEDFAQSIAQIYEDYVEVEAKLRGNLESFLETTRSFNMIYTKEIHPWMHVMEVPQLHGFGPAANRLLEAYKTLLKITNGSNLFTLDFAFM
ncbi:AUGMIN subunit 7 [Camellia lanceoleosa]|uniref:AUGMIN subunit 7 n=1 Tax=Camellia lanceoleosa TaxID=1840588 RepID=A0ACC0J040_9ERIC|nr:AUGMIN subunit 7 [Camellia lanceoleosa]